MGCILEVSLLLVKIRELDDNVQFDTCSGNGCHEFHLTIYDVE